MSDALMLGLLIVAFAGAAGYVRVCADLTPTNTANGNKTP